MSVRSEWEGLKEAIPKAYLKAMVRADLLFFSGDIAEVLSESFLERKSLPEPFDVAAHIGNAREGAMGTVAAFGMIGIFKLFAKSPDERLKAAPRVALAAFAVSSAIQVVGEKFELTNVVVPGGHNTGDVLDAAYGIGWSGLVAFGGLKLYNSIEQAVRDREAAQTAAFDAGQEGPNTGQTLS